MGTLYACPRRSSSKACEKPSNVQNFKTSAPLHGASVTACTVAGSSATPFPRRGIPSCLTTHLLPSICRTIGGLPAKGLDCMLLSTRLSRAGMNEEVCNMCCLTPHLSEEEASALDPSLELLVVCACSKRSSGPGTLPFAGPLITISWVSTGCGMAPAKPVRRSVSSHKLSSVTDPAALHSMHGYLEQPGT